ncbi:hypothetical protein KI387_040405, partial [Taxus chinensis]
SGNEGVEKPHKRASKQQEEGSSQAGLLMKQECGALSKDMPKMVVFLQRVNGLWAWMKNPSACLPCGAVLRSVQLW